MADTITVTIHRTIDIDVEVCRDDVQAPSWYHGIEPRAQFWVDEARDASNDNAVELEPHEIETAIKAAIKQWRDRE